MAASAAESHKTVSRALPLVVARTLVSAVSTLVSRRLGGLESRRGAANFSRVGAASRPVPDLACHAKRVETSLDAAGISARATLPVSIIAIRNLRRTVYVNRGDHGNGLQPRRVGIQRRHVD